MRAKAGKKQSSKDASGRAAHSAGASLRRHNELALKKVFKSILCCFECQLFYFYVNKLFCGFRSLKLANIVRILHRIRHIKKKI